MHLMKLLLSVLLFVVKDSYSKLPPFLRPCKRNDPKINECLLTNGLFVTPENVHGSREYGFPDMDPVSVDKVVLNQGSEGLSLIATDLKMYGNSHVKVTKARSDLEKGKLEWDVINDEGYQILGNYNISGKILALPITGDGKLNITLTKYSTTFTVYFDIVNKNGKEYMNVTKTNMPNKFGRVYIDIQNLFNGDKKLGDAMNRLFNENWQELSADFEPLINNVLKKFYMFALSKIASIAPFDEIFPKS